MFVTQNLFLKMLSWISILIGVGFVIASGEAYESMATVIGGGLFMALGVAGFILNKK